MDISARNSNIPNSTLFKSFYKEVWRKMIPPGLSEAEVEFIEDVAHLKPGNSVMDIMCGYGRHALPLAKKGYNVSAIDNLPDYIDEINEIASKEGLSVQGELADVTVANFSGTYDCVLSMGNYFSTFDLPTAERVLNKINQCLKTGGALIINSWMIAEIAIKHFQQKTWLYVDEFKYLLDNKYLFSPTRMETDHIVINSDGETQVLKGVDYIFTFAELDAMLNKTGFKMTEVYSTPRKRKYKFGDSTAYIVATKQ
jgi:cyclopropane fatty-acyl-phospholipid synthase-like methyltransferase